MLLIMIRPTGKPDPEPLFGEHFPPAIPGDTLALEQDDIIHPLSDSGYNQGRTHGYTETIIFGGGGGGRISPL